MRRWMFLDSSPHIILHSYAHRGATRLEIDCEASSMQGVRRWIGLRAEHPAQQPGVLSSSRARKFQSDALLGSKSEVALGMANRSGSQVGGNDMWCELERQHAAALKYLPSWPPMRDVE